MNGGALQGGTTFGSLGAGSYTLLVRDANGCEASQSVTLTAPSAPSLSANVGSQPSCGQNNGFITVSASGGRAPYQFSLNGGALQGGTTFGSLGAGSYTLLVRDANGCEASRSFTLQDEGSISLAIASTNKPGCGQTNGAITVQTNGGVAPFTYALNSGNFQNSATFTNLGAGTYTIRVRDGRGCQGAIGVELRDPSFGLSGARITIPGGGTGGGTGNDNSISLCIGQRSNLNGNLADGAMGRWSSTPQGLQFSNPNTRATTITANQAGTYLVKWSLSTTNCPNYSEASVEIVIPEIPEAKDDVAIEVETTKDIILQILDNDKINGEVTVSLVSTPSFGNVSLLPDNTIQYSAKEGSGVDEFTYEICLVNCLDACSEAVVRINVTENEEEICEIEKVDPRVVFPEGITPNNDGFNDALEFKIVDKLGCPTNYAKSDITIFNRWYDKVYYQEPYENAWYGQAQDGRELPPGIYYYVLRVKREGKKDYIRFGNVTVFKDID